MVERQVSLSIFDLCSNFWYFWYQNIWYQIFEYYVICVLIYEKSISLSSLAPWSLDCAANVQWSDHVRKLVKNDNGLPRSGTPWDLQGDMTTSNVFAKPRGFCRGSGLKTAGWDGYYQRSLDAWCWKRRWGNGAREMCYLRRWTGAGAPRTSWEGTMEGIGSVRTEHKLLDVLLNYRWFLGLEDAGGRLWDLRVIQWFRRRRCAESDGDQGRLRGDVPWSSGRLEKVLIAVAIHQHCQDHWSC